MLNNTLKTIAATIVLMGLSICCPRAFAQISDAQIWDVQTANDYSGGHYENDGFFFGAEGLYWALPGSTKSMVGDPNAEGATAYRLDWTVRNNSTQWFVVKGYEAEGDDDDDDDDDDDSSNSAGGDNGNNTGHGRIRLLAEDPNWTDVKIRDAIRNGYLIIADGNFIDLAADTYGPKGYPTMTKQHSDWDTELLGTQFHVGQRYNFGFMNGHNGWECQIFKIGGTSSYWGENVQVGFNDVMSQNNGYGDNYLKGILLDTGKKDYWSDAHEENISSSGGQHVSHYNVHETDENGVEDDHNNSDGYDYYDDDDFINVNDVEAQNHTDLFVDRLLVQFDQAKMWDEINTWGVELQYLRRAHATRIGMFELGLGVRYMKWNEEFGFWGGSDRSGNGTIYTPNFLDDTTIKTEADNNLFGPQIGLKWSRNTGRFGMEVLAKFTAAYNAQKITNTSMLGSNGYANAIWGMESMYGDLNVRDGIWGASTGGEDEDDDPKAVYYYAPNIGAGGISGYHRASYQEFTPVAELGVKFKFDLTNKINLHIGWSGIYAGNIARPSGLTDYTLNNTADGQVLGIKKDGDNCRSVVTHGFVFGITLNR